MKCPKCNGDMIYKQRPEAAVGAGKQKNAEVGRVPYCRKCERYVDEITKKVNKCPIIFCHLISFVVSYSVTKKRS